MKRLSVFLWLLCLSCSTQQAVLAQNLTMEAQAAFHYLNQMRTSAGMIPFVWNSILQQSALNHAQYLTENKVISHYEQPGKAFFSGVNPGDRALSEGYEVRNVTENYSAGGRDPLESVDGLMGAIYHRFGFLDFTKNEIGIALIDREFGYNIVYNMGNEQLDRFCRVAINTGEGRFYKDLCKQLALVPAENFDRLERETMEQNPAIVLWPPDKSTGIPTVFYEEIPDPLPNISVSGYPVSIQFNPASDVPVKLLSFRLFKLNGNRLEAVTPTHLLHKRNDPHQKLTDREFALFPLNRLEWGTNYQVQVGFEQNGQVENQIWSFTTRQLQHPMFTIAADGNSLKVIADKTYAVYIPPGGRFPFIEQLSVESPYTVRVDVDWEDKNTILLTLSGETCQPVQFFLNGNRSFTILLGDSDNLNPEQHYPRQTAETCF